MAAKTRLTSPLAGEVGAARRVQSGGEVELATPPILSTQMEQLSPLRLTEYSHGAG